jgi:hypothetical protein
MDRHSESLYGVDGVWGVKHPTGFVQTQGFYLLVVAKSALGLQKLWRPSTFLGKVSTGWGGLNLISTERFHIF